MLSRGYAIFQRSSLFAETCRRRRVFFFLALAARPFTIAFRAFRLSSAERCFDDAFEYFLLFRIFLCFRLPRR